MQWREPLVDNKLKGKPLESPADVPPRNNREPRVFSADTEGGSQSKERDARFILRLSVNEALTLLVATASLIVSALTLQNSRDTSEMKKAIGNLATLAKQTKRQADNSDRQLRILSDQAAEQKAQTSALQSQTVAINSSSKATIRAADAQGVVANTAVKTQMPNLTLSKLQLTGFDKVPDDMGMIELALTWEFSNKGGPLTMKQFAFFPIISDVLPPQMPIMAMSPGNDIPVVNTPGSGFTTTEPIKLFFDKALIDKVVTGKTGIFFIGKAFFVDVLGNSHTKCFGFRLSIKDNQSRYFAPAGGAAYHCDT